MSSYLIILILNLIFLPPMLSLLSLPNFISKFFFIMVNNIASIFSILKLTVFRMFYLITTLLIFYRISIILFTLPPIINPKLFIKDR